MKKRLKKIIVPLAAVALLAACVLTVASFFTGIWLDCSRDGQRWCCSYVMDGCVTFTYANRVMPPTLKTAGVSAYEAELQAEYAGRWTQYSVLELYARDRDVEDPPGLVARAATSVKTVRRSLTTLLAGLATVRGVHGFFAHVSMTPDREMVLRFPLWFFVLSAIAITTWLIWRGARRTPPGHCKVCGYNLTGNLSGICPECGVAIGGGSTPLPPIPPSKPTST